MSSDLLTTQEASEFLKVSCSTLYRYCEKGSIPHIKKGFGLRFRKEDLEKWLFQDIRRSRLAEGILKNALTNSPPADISKMKGGEMAIRKKGRRHFAYGSIYQRNAGGSWTIDFYGPGNERVQKVAKGASTWQEAHDALRKSVFQAYFPDDAKPQEKRIGFKEFSKTYLNDHAHRKRSLQADKSRMKALIQHFKNCDLREITRLDIERFVSSRLDAKNTESTCNRYLALLKAMLNIAIGEGYLERNPTKGIKLFSERKVVKERIISKEEEAKLVAESSPKLRSVVRIMLNAGLRPSEVFNLKWSNIDLSRRVLTVEETKDDEVRHIPLNKVLFDEFKCLQEIANHSRYVFINPKTGRPITTVKTAFRAACRRAGLKGIRLYDCRHTFASRLIQNGCDIETVRALLGHSDIRVTMRYAHSTDNVKRAAVDLLNPKRAFLCDDMVTKAGDRISDKTSTPYFSVN